MDLAVAHRMAMEYISQKESINLVLNIGRGESNSILDLINSFERVNKIKVNYEFTDRRKGDNAVSLVSTENMLNIFNWKPEKTIDDMCKDGWKWQLNFLKSN